jgi:hypothetical protein
MYLIKRESLHKKDFIHNNDIYYCDIQISKSNWKRNKFSPNSWWMYIIRSQTDVCVCTQRQMLFVQKDKIMNLYPFFQGYKNASISLMIANLTDCVSLKTSSHVLYQCQSYFQRFIYKKKLFFFQSCIHQ